MLEEIKKESVLATIRRLLNFMFILMTMMFLVGIFFIYRSEAERYRKENQELVDSYVENVEVTMADLDVHMWEILTDLADEQTAVSLRKENGYSRTSTESGLYEKMNYKCSHVENMDILFLLDEEGSTRIWAYAQNTAAVNKIAFWDYLDTHSYETYDWNENRWQLYWLNDTPFYLRIYRMNGFILGAFSTESNYSSALRERMDGDEFRWLIYDQDGLIGADFDLDGKDYSYYLSQTGFRSGQAIRADFSDVRGTYCVLFDNGIRNLYLNVFVILFAGLMLLLVFLNLAIRRLWRINVQTPVDQLVITANKVKQGDYDYRMEEKSRGEFLVMEQAFNSALQTVVDLKIDQYEKELLEQEKELKALRQQLKPHFYLNALAVVKGMASQGKAEEIQRYIEVLTVYIRYMIRNKDAEAKILDELNHVTNYVNMQKLCFPNKVTAFIQCEDSCMDCMIPVLMLHTIVENAFKHAMSSDNYLMFNLNIHMEESCTEESRTEKSCTEKHEGDKETKGMIVIDYEDSGDGFSEEDLARYSKTDFEEKNHLGLNNLRRTLELRYHRSNLFEIANTRPHGARVTIRIPLS